MADPWVVSVLSTAYDLQDYRKAVIDLLKEKSFTVSAYELSEFPVETDLHSHDSCLIALQRANIALVIIDKRSGGTYCGVEDNTDNCTITEREYLEAIEQNIPIFFFVKKEAFDEAHAYNNAFRAYCASKQKRAKTKHPDDFYKQQFDKTYRCTYVQSIKTLDFINNIQHNYSNHEASNWMDFFTDINNLKSSIEGKLKGYSRRLVQDLAVAQKNALLNRHTSTAIGMSLGDVFSSGYYIEAPHRFDSGMTKSATASSLSDEIKNTSSTNNSLLIYGEAGYGKTTILAKCFSEHVDSLIQTHSYDIPLFLPLRNKGKDYSFDIEEFIIDDLKELKSKESYPYLDLSHLKLRLYCDGFDELAETLSETDLTRIRTSTIFQYPLVLTCRQQYKNRYLNEYRFSDKFGIRIQMQKWDIATAKKYISNFCIKSNICKEKEEMIIKAIDKSPDLQELLDSPLLVTMFLWFLEYHQAYENISNISRIHLFNCWITDLAKRECAKTEEYKVPSDTLLQTWEFVAWQLYKHRLQNKNLKIADITDMVEQKFNNVFHGKVSLWLDALFESKSEYITGTFHEQFMEYLIARLLVSACAQKIEPYPEFLQTVLRPEINRYFRGIWNEKSAREQKQIYDAIFDRYIMNITKTSNEEIATRVHAAYHMCRLESDRRNECIEFAFQAETHVSVKLSLYFGAIKLGQLEREEEFYNLLSQSEDYSKANRGYHLAYYADTIQTTVMPYYDDEVSDWQGTLKAFERHFENEGLDHFFLRRIDLFTMKTLINSRNKKMPLTEEKIEYFRQKIDSCRHNTVPDYQEYSQKIKKEFDELVTVFRKQTT